MSECKSKPNLQKLDDYINQQPNPKEFAALLLAVAAMKPRGETRP